MTSRCVALVAVLMLLGAIAELQAQCDPDPVVACDGMEPIPPFGERTSYVQDLPALGFFGNCVEDYRLYLPTGVKPLDGWPVLVHLDLTGFYDTVDFPCLDPTATGNPPVTFNAYTQRRLARILGSGIAVVTARATPSLPEGFFAWADFCPCDPSQAHPGNGLFHPPGAQSMINGVPVETYQVLNYANAEKDAVMLVQHVRYWAQQTEVPNPVTVQAALSLLDDANIIVDGTSAGATALMWTVFGPDRGLAAPFFGNGGQYDVPAKPKAAILRNGLIWPPIMAECNENLASNTPHFGCDEGGDCCPELASFTCGETFTGFGSSATVGARSFRYADARELMQSGALWYSSQQPEIPVYMRYEQDFACLDYSPNAGCTLLTSGGCAASTYSFCFTGMGEETKVHPAWSGYTWKNLHGSATRLVINGSAAYLKKDATQDTPVDFSSVLGLLFPQPEITTPAEEDECTKDQILWLHKIVGSPAVGQEAWIRIDWGPLGSDVKSVAVAGGHAPRLSATGTCIPADPPSNPTGSAYEIRVTQAAPLASGQLVVGTQQLLAPFRGGYLVPVVATTIPFMTDATGTWSMAGTWPALPAGTNTFYQAWVADAGAPSGWAGTGGLLSVTQSPP